MASMLPLFSVGSPYDMLLANLREHMAEFSSWLTTDRGTTEGTARQYTNLVSSMLAKTDIRDGELFNLLLNNQYAPSSRSLRITARNKWLDFIGGAELVEQEQNTKRSGVRRKPKAAARERLIGILRSVIHQWLEAEYDPEMQMPEFFTTASEVIEDYKKSQQDKIDKLLSRKTYTDDLNASADSDLPDVADVEAMLTALKSQLDKE